jgi:NADPH-dependent 2,4-dienoyl-CoA reductase/sulfur reductase-like enzyme/ferredoxin
MAGAPIVEIREPGQPVRRVTLDRATEVGRDCDGELVSDEEVSGRHLRLVPTPIALSVVDLGSEHGTMLNGTAITGRAVLEPGDVVRLGRTEIIMIGRMGSDLGAPVVRTAPRPPAAQPPSPPAPPAPPKPPSSAGQLVALTLGTGPRPGQPLFPAYTEMPRRIPVRFWHAIRIGSVLAYLALCIGLFIAPSGALFAFFKVVVPLLPITFFVAPGLWRNICPLAAANQAPRVLGFSRALTAPDWLRRYGAIIAVTLFFGITAARIAFFNSNGAGLGVLLLLTIVNAFVAGVSFKGKSGWCSSMCPLLPLQRVYGQTPLANVPNSHCQPCVGCTKNCYDFRPSVAYQADMHDPDPEWTRPRRFFVAALPGYVLGFFLLVNHPGLALPGVYLRLAGFFLGSVGLFYLLQALLRVRTGVLVTLFGAAAINIFYWYASLTVVSSVATITGAELPWLRYVIRAGVLALSLFWIARTFIKERQYEDDVASRPAVPVVQISPRATRAARLAAAADAKGATAEADRDGAATQVRFADSDATVPAEIGVSLLALAERQGLPIESGCRMGVCGADPVAVLDGGGCLSAADEDELNTLRRLGYADNTRMACVARILSDQSGPVTVALTPESGDATRSRPSEFDRTLASVVVLGNGIAGVTAADFVRRGHPECEIHLVGSEPHVLYNRMGISRLVYGRSAMQGLYLLPEQWYDDHQVIAWLNTVARRIDVESRRVFLATGETLPYDRLILAMGSSSTLPPVAGFGLPGSFVLRSADDAMRVRAYTQLHGCREAVVAGGGLLGLEAAHSLLELGLRVTVLERGRRLLARQVDERCSELLDAYFTRIGLQVSYGAESEALVAESPAATAEDQTPPGEDRVRGVALRDGRTLPCDIFLGAIGIRSNAELAREAGITVNRGVIVDDRMATSAPGVFAAGDVAEHGGMTLGLWPIAAKQGEVAAVNALGGDAALTAEIPATILKGVGLDLFSIGRSEAQPGDVVIADEDADPRAPSYRRLIIADGRAVGAIVLGAYPEFVALVTAAVKNRKPISSAQIAELQRGSWEALKDTAPVSQLSGS